MKWLGCFLIGIQIAWPQLKTGSIVFIHLSQDELIMAADSRSTILGIGYNDSECKISAFGKQFIFSFTGAAWGGESSQWDVHLIARRSWQTQSNQPGSDKPMGLAHAVSKAWTTEIETIYNSASFIKKVRSISAEGDGVISSAVFAATANSGELVAIGVTILYDKSLFEGRGVVRIFHEETVFPTQGETVLGYDEIANEFKSLTSQRAREYMKWFMPQIVNLPVSERKASLASKLVELSILLHPKNINLGFPIDVIQFARQSGANWISIKPNCPNQ